MMRPPVSLARLRLLPEKHQVLHFPKLGGDDPGPPQPQRIDLVRYHGYYSNAARGKRRRDYDSRLARAGADLEQEVAASPDTAALRKRWADLLRRVYEVDPLVCPRCSATMRVVGFITRRETIDRILDHLRRPTTSRPRSPPAPAASIPAPLS